MEEQKDRLCERQYSPASTSATTPPHSRTPRQSLGELDIDEIEYPGFEVKNTFLRTTPDSQPSIQRKIESCPPGFIATQGFAEEQARAPKTTLPELGRMETPASPTEAKALLKKFGIEPAVTARAQEGEGLGPSVSERLPETQYLNSAAADALPDLFRMETPDDVTMPGLAAVGSSLTAPVGSAQAAAVQFMPVCIAGQLVPVSPFQIGVLTPIASTPASSRRVSCTNSPRPSCEMDGEPITPGIGSDVQVQPAGLLAACPSSSPTPSPSLSPRAPLLPPGNFVSPRGSPTDRSASPSVPPGHFRTLSPQSDTPSMVIDTQVFSVGSAKHHKGGCKPCAWNHTTQGCDKGANCNFCHLCDKGERKRRQKKRHQAQKAAAEH